MYEYQVVSADTHLETPPDRWTGRLPKHLRDRGPKVVDLPDGGQGWLLGEGEPVPLGLAVTGGQKYNEFKTRGRSYDEGLPGTGGPEQRLEEQDLDGTDAEVLFSTVIGTMLTKMDDPELIRATVTAYNDWLSEYCSYKPERLFGIALIPFTGIDDAVAELRRIAGKPGIRGAHLLRFPAGGNWGMQSDDDFWAAAQETDTTIVAHHNFGGEDGSRAHPMPGMSDKPLEMAGGGDLSMFAWMLTCDMKMPTLPILTIEQLFLGGVLDRFPKLRFHFAETGIGWLPYWLEQVEDRYDRHKYWVGVDLPRRPLEYVRDHFTFSFQEDHAGVALRDRIGVDNICWASDFPHSVGDWPWSRETRARQFDGLPVGERRRIEALNIVAQLRVITPDEKEKLAGVPRTEPRIAQVPFRGERRSA